MSSASLETHLQDLAATLVARHGCHTVILYGSRGRGTHRADSDYDLLLVRDSGGNARDVRPWHGTLLDAFVYEEGSPDLDPERAPGLMRIRRGKLLWDEKGFGERLVQRVREVFKRGPPPLPEEEVAMMRAWVEKTLKRVVQRDAGPVESDYRRVTLLQQLLVSYFEFRGIWFLGPEESLRWLSRQEPAAHAAFAAALAPGAPYEAIERLARLVLQDDKVRAAA